MYMKKKKSKKTLLKHLVEELNKKKIKARIRAKGRAYSTLRVAKAEKKKEYQGYFQK